MNLKMLQYNNLIKAMNGVVISKNKTSLKSPTSRIIKIILFLFLGFMLLSACGNNDDCICDSTTLSSEEQKLYNLIMQYRQGKSLPEIPISASLTCVAQTHVKDLSENYSSGTSCNMHSWSNKGSWTDCCYTDNHAKAACMWNKPREFTSYKGNGYEIAHWYSAGATAESALNGWKASSGHNEVIINGGSWTKKWNAIGIGIHKGFAVVWFGNELDE
jgi:uncharacterized protein YkwD